MSVVPYSCGLQLAAVEYNQSFYHSAVVSLCKLNNRRLASKLMLTKPTSWLVWLYNLSRCHIFWHLTNYSGRFGQDLVSSAVLFFASRVMDIQYFDSVRQPWQGLLVLFKSFPLQQLNAGGPPTHARLLPLMTCYGSWDGNCVSSKAVLLICCWPQSQALCSASPGRRFNLGTETHCADILARGKALYPGGPPVSDPVSRDYDHDVWSKHLSNDKSSKNTEELFWG